MITFVEVVPELLAELDHVIDVICDELPVGVRVSARLWLPGRRRVVHTVRHSAGSLLHL
jgi:hypothetical protein